jgi:simple sugar transport system ATP-binding protein
VEILKILYRNAEILIFDEPTASLTPQEVDELLVILQRLKAEGKTIVFITHKLKEIKAVSDRCTVLRRGRSVGTVEVAGSNEEQLAEMMVGREVNFNVEKGPARPGKVVLTVENLTVPGNKGTAVNKLSLEVREGEIVGIAGVDGNGQAELVDAIYGLARAKSGRILLNGKEIEKHTIRKRIADGIGLVPEDRQKYGLVLGFRIDENFILKNFRKPPYSNKIGFLQFPLIARHAGDLIEQFDIRAGKGPATLASGMSGGNQQKAIVAREIDQSPALLIVAQPTRGLDVGAIEYIHKRIVEERDKGRAVLLVSFELDEVMALCDRIITVSKGEVMGVVDAKDADEKEIGLMMTGTVKTKGATV